MSDSTLRPTYVNSHALVIGINAYSNAAPLGYAVSDAEAVAGLLTSRLNFPTANVHLLLDQHASRDAILRSFTAFAGDSTGANDRLLVFFAGHGHTIRSRKGDVGFLVPFDGSPADIGSLIRWDELTRNADFLNAKHVLFLMDACYGGLAVMRALQPGSMRFLKDMLLRPARQVLTAGKADELVADLGGPLANHSVFTGHLLEALSGEAADAEGVITANGVMAYVYHRVGRDSGSRQTPHFGYLDGDGDFVFAAPSLDTLQEDDKMDIDVLVPLPSIPVQTEGEEEMALAAQVKDLLSDDRHRIRLHDLVAHEVRSVLAVTGGDDFPVDGPLASQSFAERLVSYERATTALRDIQCLLGFWSSPAHQDSLTLAPRRLSGSIGRLNGWTELLSVRWYPVLLLLYSGGIAAIAGQQYANLRALLCTAVDNTESRGGTTTLVEAVWTGLSNVHDSFKTLPGHEKHYVPHSEYLFKLIQPSLDDLLFLGTDYEALFDRYEVMMALEHAHNYSQRSYGRAWGPVGRFGWKFRRGVSNPLASLVAEATEKGNSWSPLQAGLFGGSMDRFRDVADQYAALLSQLNWF